MKLIGICRLGRDAEVKVTSSGKAVANLSLAYNFGQKDSEGKRQTQWVEAALWGDQAERLAQYLLKGTALYVTCRDVHIETYEGRNGQGTKLVGTVADIEFLPKQRESVDSKQPSAQRPASAHQQQAAAPASRPDPAPSSGSFDDLEDDIPF